MISSKKIDVIPIEVAYTEQPLKIWPRSSQFIRIAHSRSHMSKCPLHHSSTAELDCAGVEISWVSIRDLSDIERLLNGSQHMIVSSWTPEY
jgi:hypothetical protein